MNHTSSAIECLLKLKRNCDEIGTSVHLYNIHIEGKAQQDRTTMDYQILRESIDYIVDDLSPRMLLLKSIRFCM